MADILGAQKSTKKLGEWLYDEGVISASTLKSALDIQRQHGGKLGDILTHHGHLPTLTMHQILAEQHGLRFVNLLDQTLDSSLLKAEHISRYIQYGFIPYRQEEGCLILAITDPKISLNASIFKGQPVRFVMTSPLDIVWSIQSHFSHHLTDDARHYLRNNFPHYSLTQSTLHAKETRSIANLIIPTLLLLVLACLFAPVVTVSTIITLSSAFFLACLCFKMIIFITGWKHRAEIFKQTQPPEQDSGKLPIYTVLVPLFHEADSIGDIIHSLSAIDYPPDKLDIKLIVEEVDQQTVAAIKRAQPDARFQLMVVPASQPQTKPKACNYALRFARGEFVTIYDAEDAPDPQQLRKAVATFRKHGDQVVCLQGRLNYYNHNECLLTRLFSLEYAMLFDYMLPALYHLGIPIPLGGTSNHIRRDVLEKLGAWDAYNVTEDADLGIRFAAENHLTMPISSLTREEAPISTVAWVKQRSRWIKGYLQTWAVMSRRSVVHRKQLGILGFVGIHFFIGASSLSFVLAPFLWIGSLLWWVIPPTWLTLPPWVMMLATFTLLFGAITQYVCAAITNSERKKPYHGGTLFFFPFYFILHSIASMRSVWQLIFAPYHWDKTSHGKSTVSRAHLTASSKDAIQPTLIKNG